MSSGAKKVEITVDSLLGQLEAAIIGATRAEQFGAVNGAVALMGRLKGLLRDRLEVVNVSGFNSLQEPEDALAQIREDYGNAVAEVLRSLFITYVFCR
jgi:hypothetical protein